MGNIEKQLAFFNQNKDELLSNYSDLFIIISPELTIDAFASLSDAYVFGVKSYGSGNFLLKDCSSKSQAKIHIITPNIVLA